MTYMLDTNIVSFLLEGNEAIIKKFDEIFMNHEIKISEMVYYEIQRGLNFKDSKKRQKLFDTLCNNIEFIPLNLDTFKKGAEIYSYLKKSGKIIEDDDILIGAAAIINDAILVTNNTKHLGRINDLKLEDWNIS